MFDLVSVGNAPLTMTSREVAELTGKRHDNVMADIRKMLSELDIDPLNFQEVYTAGNGQGQKQYALPKRECLVLVSGYSVQMRARIIDRWQELEGAAPKPVELSRMDILRLAMDAEEARIKAEAERDEAIRTKALIGSKREATAMATAAAAKREVAKLKDALGVNSRQATVTAVEKATKQKFEWLPLKRWCTAHAVEPEVVPDERYGVVKAWPADAWGEIYGIVLADIFGE